MNRFRFMFLTALWVGLPIFGQIHTTLQSHANPFPQIRRYADLWADGNFAYVGSDVANGVLIFDISNPASPVMVANYAPSNAPDMEDVKVVNGVGYFASNTTGGVHIVNVADPAHPQLLSRISSANGGYDGVHNITVSNGVLYMSDYPRTPALKAFDVTDPVNPVLLWTWLSTDPLYIHDLIVKNGRLYTSGWGGKTDIWDVTSVRTRLPVLLGSVSSGLASHSCDVTDDGNTLACTRELASGGNLTIYNISNLSNPQALITLTAPSLGISAVAPSDPRIVGNTMYVSWDQAGLVVFDISVPSQPVIIGIYDQYPGALQTGSFDGAWGVYPFLGADRVLLSDRDTGLWIIDTTGVSSQPALLSLNVNPNLIPANTQVTGTVFLVGKADPTGIDITLSSTGPVSVTSIHTPGGVTSATFPVDGLPVTTPTAGSVSAAFGGSTVSQAVTVALPQPMSIAITPANLLPGATGTATVTFNSPVQSDTSLSVSVVSGASVVSAVPASVLVPTGSSSATFSITAATNVPSSTPVQVAVSANGRTATTTINVIPNAPSSIVFGSTYLIGGTNDTLTVNFPAAVQVDTTVTLAVVSGGNALFSMPPTMTVPAGSTSATVPIQTATVTGTVKLKVSATANGGGTSFTVSVLPNLPTTVTFSNSSAYAPNPANATVILTKATAFDAVVTLSATSGASAVTALPSTVTVPAGFRSVSFPIVTDLVSTATPVVIAASYNGGTQSGTFTVRPNVPALTFSANTVFAGASLTGKITLSAAVAVADQVTITVGSGASAIKTIPATVAVPTGTTFLSFPITTDPALAAPTPVQITTTLQGVTSTNTLTVNTNSPSVVTFTPATIVAGATTSVKITMSQNVTASTVVPLTVVSGSAAVSNVPASVTIAANTNSATFTLQSVGTISASTPVQISASFGGGSATGTLTVNPNVPAAVSFAPAAVVGGNNTTATVTFGRAVTADTTVTLTAVTNGTALANLPASITVLTGATSAQATITTAAVSASTAVQISASAYGGTASQTLTVNPNVPATVTFAPASLISGASTTGTVSFGRAVAQDTPVTLTVNSGAAGVSSIPPTVLVPAGATSATFTVASASVGALTTVQISAAANSGSASGSFTVSANVPSGASASPSPVVAGRTVTGTVTFGGAVPVDTPITLGVVSGNVAVSSQPSSVTVLAGTSSATWSIVTNATITTSTTVQVSASANGATRTASFVVNPITPGSLVLSPATVVGGVTSTATIALTGPVAVDTMVTISAPANAFLTSLPASATVLAGSSGVTFPVGTNSGVSSSGAVPITVALNGASAGANLTVTPNLPAVLSFAPATAVGGNTVTGTVSLSAAASVDTAVNLNVVAGSSAIWSIPASVTILAGTATATFPIVTSGAITSATSVQITASANGGSKTTTFTVTANVPSGMTFSPTYVTGGYPVTATVLFGRAVAADTPVALAVVAGSSAFGSMPSTITVPAGASSASFVIQTVPVSSATTMKIAATANGGNFTANLAVTANFPGYLAFAPASVVAGVNTVGTLSLQQKATVDVPVTVTVVSGGSAITSIPTTVIVPTGSLSASFAVSTANVTANTTVQVTVAANGGSRTASFTVTPNVPSSVTFTPTTTMGGNTVTAKVTFAKPLPSDTVVTLNVVAGAPAVTSIPASVVVTAGTTNVTFPIATTSTGSSTTVQVSASANGGTASGSFIVN